MEYLGPEPDRWRSTAEPELNAAQAPEHFINMESTEPFLPLPPKRFDFEAKVYAAGKNPAHLFASPGLRPLPSEPRRHH